MRSDERPGLLLLCHGDLPGTLLADPECCRLYDECMETLGQVTEVSAAEGDDCLSGLSGRIASFLSAESDGPVGVAYLGLRRPGIREAIYSMVSSGSRTIVCVCGAGLMVPGHGASAHMPAAIGQVVAENAGLDVRCAPPGLNPRMASALVMASVEGALAGRCMPPQPSWEAPRIGDDVGVLVVTVPDHAAAGCGAAPAGLAPAIERLDERARSLGQPAEMAVYMSAVAECLEASGAFCAVRPGYLDFADPGLEAAAEGLTDAGARLIIAAGTPLLLGRHELSWADPSDAILRLKESCGADILYVMPDPAASSLAIAAGLRMMVLEAIAAPRRAI